MKAYPPGDIEEALLGNNPKHVAYFAEPPEDPWGTPYGIYRSSKNIVIRSAGPDRTFATGSTARSDDLFYSYSAKAAR